MRLVLDLEYKGKFEEHFWNELKLVSDGRNVIVGGDFNMDPNKMRKEINKYGLDISLTPNSGQTTFRRWDSVNERQQESSIDHIMISKETQGGMSTVDAGTDAKDHAIIVGWINLSGGIKRVKEKKAVRVSTIRPTDKGAIRQYERIFKRIPIDRVDSMKVEEILNTTMEGGQKNNG